MDKKTGGVLGWVVRGIDWFGRVQTGSTVVRWGVAVVPSGAAMLAALIEGQPLARVVVYGTYGLVGGLLTLLVLLEIRQRLPAAGPPVGLPSPTEKRVAASDELASSRLTRGLPNTSVMTLRELWYHELDPANTKINEIYAAFHGQMPRQFQSLKSGMLGIRSKYIMNSFKESKRTLQHGLEDIGEQNEAVQAAFAEAWEHYGKMVAFTLLMADFTPVELRDIGAFDPWEAQHKRICRVLRGIASQPEYERLHGWLGRRLDYATVTLAMLDSHREA